MAKKKKNVSLFLLLIACLLLIIGGGGWWRWVNLPLDKNTTQPEIFVVQKGESIESIGQRLDQAHLIKNVAAFRISVLLKGVSRNIQAGSFSLGKNLSLSQLVEQLTHGTLDFWVTIPEGLRLEEVAARVAQQAQASKSVFDEAEFIRLSQELEGQLFPDTYLIPQGASAEQIVDIFRVNFVQKMSQINNSTDLTQKQLVILASLIEREAKHDIDRPIIAGILIKRLENDWPLQIDATIQYALGWQPDEQIWWKKNLTKTAEAPVLYAYHPKTEPFFDLILLTPLPASIFL